MQTHRVVTFLSAAVIGIGASQLCWARCEKRPIEEGDQTPPCTEPTDSSCVQQHPPSPRDLPPDFNPYRPDYERYAPYGHVERGYRDYTYRQNEPYDPRPFDIALERAYQQGVADGRALGWIEFRTERALSGFADALADGHKAFAEGRYRDALRSFRRAAALDHGDASSRLGAGHALFALDDYPNAARSIRRALELQPRIVFLPLDIRGAYDDREQFAHQLERLRNALRGAPDAPDLWYLLGYCYHFTGRPAEAGDAFGRAARLRPLDRHFGWVAQQTSAAHGNPGAPDRRPRE